MMHPRFFLILALLTLSQNTYSQDSSAELVESISSSLGRDDSGLVQNLEKELKDAFSALEESEKELISQKHQLESHGIDATDYVKTLEVAILELTLDEKKELLESPRREPLQTDSAKMRELRAMIQEGRDQTDVFFENLDAHIQKSLDVSIAYSFMSLFEYLKAVDLNEEQKKSVTEKLSKLQHLKKKYMENKHHYGEGKDTYRTGAYYSFFVNLKALYESIENEKFKVRPSVLTKLRSSMLKVFKILTRLPEYRHLAFSGLRFLKSALKPSPSTQKNIALNTDLNKVMQEITKLKGMRVEVEGGEHLPTTYEKNTINIYAASHRNALFDQIALAHMGVENMVFFGAPNNFIPNFLNKILKTKDKIIVALNKNPGFIVVGKGADLQPIDKALKIVKETTARSFLIFPGGRLPEGLGATMGVRKKFASDGGLLSSFEEAGFKVNIVPISMRHNATLFDEATPLTEFETLTVRVGQNISHETRKIISHLGGDDALRHLLRYALVDDLVTNDKLLWGQVRVGALKKTLTDYLKPVKAMSCKKIL